MTTSFCSASSVSVPARSGEARVKPAPTVIVRQQSSLHCGRPTTDEGKREKSDPSVTCLVTLAGRTVATRWKARDHAATASPVCRFSELSASETENLPPIKPWPHPPKIIFINRIVIRRLHHSHRRIDLSCCLGKDANSGWQTPCDVWE